MPDDNQTVTEPRSAVEAASSQGHGGSNPLLWGLVTGAAPERTIKAGIGRLMQLAKGSRFLVNDLDAVVGSLTGVCEGAVDSKVDEGVVMGTAEAMHSALDVIEEAYGQLVAMTQRAKAAHG